MTYKSARAPMAEKKYDEVLKRILAERNRQEDSGWKGVIKKS
jgi:hypothetical protein